MRMFSVVAVLSTTTLIACSKNDAGSADSTRLADSATAAASSSASTPAAPALTDANIFALLDEANMGDSANGKLASTKGTNADVKDFGRMMMRDHHTLRKGGQDLAAKLAVTPTPPANDSLPAMAKAMTDSMTSMPKGANWDKAYIAQEVAVHEKVLGLIDAALGAAQAPELKDMLTKARPNVDGHLLRARNIQGKLGTGTTN